jgi:hypothetical protein
MQPSPSYVAKKRSPSYGATKRSTAYGVLVVGAQAVASTAISSQATRAPTQTAANALSHHR